MLIPSMGMVQALGDASLSRRVNANSQLHRRDGQLHDKLIKKGEC